jgi:MoaA/NifB/PqqE/SkfB family radical SAM enzyme
MGQNNDSLKIVCLDQMGEPLLNKNIVEYIQITKQRGHFVVSPAIEPLLKETKVIDLLAAGLDHIIFSFED